MNKDHAYLYDYEFFNKYIHSDKMFDSNILITLSIEYSNINNNNDHLYNKNVINDYFSKINYTPNNTIYMNSIFEHIDTTTLIKCPLNFNILSLGVNVYDY